MSKDTRKLQVLDGYRHAFSHSPRLQSRDYSQPLRKQEVSHPRNGDPNRQNLVPALTAMEQRLSSLLEDRSRIGQDLHDCILQSLYAIEFNMQARNIVSSDRATGTKQSHEDIAGQINRLIGEIRQMIQELNTGIVKDPCLMADLHALKSIYDEIGNVRVTLDLQHTALEVLTRDEEREILNIIREALSNCVRHAHATQATISIRRRGTKIRVHISDDGNGFACRDDRSRGYGQIVIESRAKKIGGNVCIQSEEGRGTHILVEFSLEPMLVPL